MNYWYVTNWPLINVTWVSINYLLIITKVFGS